MRLLPWIAFLSLAGCSSPPAGHDRAGHPGTKSRLKAEAQHVGHKTEDTTEAIGSKLHHIFREEVPASE